jgi:hypothetical protein
MTLAAIKKSKKIKSTLRAARIFHKANEDHQKAEEMFVLLGWADLPSELKVAIEADVKGYADELEGHYCTSSEWVQRRRESVDFWVHSFQDGLCSLETAVQALKVPSLSSHSSAA